MLDSPFTWDKEADGVLENLIIREYGVLFLIKNLNEI